MHGEPRSSCTQEGEQQRQEDQRRLVEAAAFQHREKGTEIQKLEIDPHDASIARIFAFHNHPE
jgi:hypothetical protein